MTEDSLLTLPRPPVVTIRGARKADLPELNEMITLLAAHHGDAAAITAEKLERDDFSTLWSGQNTSGCREIPAAKLTRLLAAHI